MAEDRPQATRGAARRATWRAWAAMACLAIVAAASPAAVWWGCESRGAGDCCRRRPCSPSEIGLSRCEGDTVLTCLPGPECSGDCEEPMWCERPCRDGPFAPRVCASLGSGAATCIERGGAACARPGETACEGSAVLRCARNGFWEHWADCSAGAAPALNPTCASSAGGIAVCSHEGSRPCDPESFGAGGGGYACEGDRVLRCDAEARVTVVVSECAPGTHCEEDGPAGYAWCRRVSGGDADADADADADSTDTPPPVCGNGVVEAGEECEGTGGPCWIIEGRWTRRSGWRDCWGCRWTACGRCSVPPNDSCDDPGVPSIAEVGARQHFEGSTCGATHTVELGCAGEMLGPDVVYRLDLTYPRHVVLDTVGTSFDGALRIEDATTCPGPSLACDDNSALGAPPQARLDLLLDPGAYWVVVDGSRALQFGPYVLNVWVEGAP